MVISRSPAAPPRSAADTGGLPLVLGSIRDSLGVRRITAALRGAAETGWYDSYAELRAGLAVSVRRVLVVVIDLQDRTGAVAHGFATIMREDFPGIGLVAYGKTAPHEQADLCGLGAAGVHDVLLPGHTDEGFAARSIILGAARRGAADLVLGELPRLLPKRLVPFADAVIRNPSKGSIAKITEHLGIHRQTPNFWCRKERHLRPEELLVWCRLFLAAALLELTGRTLDSIAIELDYASATSLRNQLKSYTGMTATQIRQVGVHRIFELFLGRVDQAHRGLSGGNSSARSGELTREKAEVG